MTNKRKFDSFCDLQNYYHLIESVTEDNDLIIELKEYFLTEYTQMKHLLNECLPDDDQIKLIKDVVMHIKPIDQSVYEIYTNIKILKIELHKYEKLNDAVNDRIYTYIGNKSPERILVDDVLSELCIRELNKNLQPYNEFFEWFKSYGSPFFWEHNFMPINQF
jgi:DNA-directed RNA polymerase beta' subunit